MADRINQGYVITDSIQIGEMEFVFGKLDSNTPMYVTWACKGGDNYFWGHYFSDLLEAKAALLACLENTALPVLCTMTFGEDGRTFMGTTPAIAAATLSAIGASAVGLNCSLGPAELAELLRQMAPYARCPLMVQPNAGLPRVNERGETVFDVGPDEFSAAMEGILAAGAAVVGGCCGTTPAHIARLRQLLAEAPFAAPAYRPSFLVTSAQAMAELRPDSPNIAVIGERINPTGKKRLKAALLAGDFDVAVAEAVAQVGAGADILDVNVGVPGLDEPAVLRAVAGRSSTRLPARRKAWRRCCRWRPAMAPLCWVSRWMKGAFPPPPRSASPLPGASWRRPKRPVFRRKT